MPTINRFEDLTAWQKARLVSQEIYKITKSKLFFDDLDLKRQIRRASGSVMDNIAEGYSQGDRTEFIQFLSIAKGSLTEVKSQLYRALDDAYITQPEFDLTYSPCDEAGRLTDGLMNYLKNTEIKGLKYKKDP